MESVAGRLLVAHACSIFDSAALIPCKKSEWEDFFHPAVSETLRPQIFASATVPITHSSRASLAAINKGAHFITPQPLVRMFPGQWGD